MKLEYRGFTITESNDRGGKAGTGCNITTSLQVRSEDPFFFRYIRYSTLKVGAKSAAIVKAKARIDKFLDEQKKT